MGFYEKALRMALEKLISEAHDLTDRNLELGGEIDPVLETLSR